MTQDEKIEELRLSLMTRDIYLQHQASIINKLEIALRRIKGLNWGTDGDCGAKKIVDSVLGD